jgi:hypothetical protein
MTNTNCIPEYLPSESLTVRVPRQSMKELVYGPPPRRRSPIAGAIALGVLIGLMGCASAPRAVDTETVGTLTASTTHVSTAAVHATTDFGHAELVTTDDDDAPAVAAPVVVELPEVATKTDGIVVGGGR